MKINILGLCIIFITSSILASDQLNIHKEGLVNYYAKQGDIVKLGKIEGSLPVSELSGVNATFAVGACGNLNGEITVFESKPYVTKMQDDSFIMSHNSKDMAIFAVWTKNNQWRNEHVPSNVMSYLDLQYFVKERATAAGIDTSTTPFPFLITGRPAELKWHINVNRTDGEILTKKLFNKSKKKYVLRDEEVNIVGFYSEKHHGDFIGTYSPAINNKSVQNAIHIHLVSKDGSKAGHIDDLRFEGDMTLRLPK